MRNLNSIPLSALRTIEAIGRTGTLASAANELGVTPGALSQRLAKAEAILGQPLFLRTSTGLKPTEACQQSMPRLTRAIADLSFFVQDISAKQDDTLTVTVAPIFASRWLIWRIQKFTSQNPNINVRVEPRVELVDMETSGIDIGIRVSEKASVGLGAIKLLEQRVFPVCSPDIAERIKTPTDLFSFPIIRENERFYGWKEWLSEQGLPMRDFKTGPTYGDATMCLDAAMTGQGVFMAWETLACDALERGQIASPFPLRAQTGASYWFATGRYSAQKPAVKKFQKWLQDELECSTDHWRTASA
jgi:LysR family glycine cleavage system transcriptional activator